VLQRTLINELIFHSKEQTKKKNQRKPFAFSMLRSWHVRGVLRVRFKMASISRVFVKSCSACSQRYVTKTELAGGQSTRTHQEIFDVSKFPASHWQVCESDHSVKQGRCAICVRRSKRVTREQPVVAIADPKNFLTNWGRWIIGEHDPAWQNPKYIKEFTASANDYYSLTEYSRMPKSFLRSVCRAIREPRARLVKLAACASDANAFLWCIASQHVNKGVKIGQAPIRGEVLVFDGCYVAGRGPAQSRSSTEWLAALANVPPTTDLIVPAPWGYEFESEILSNEFGTELSDHEQHCLEMIRGKLKASANIGVLLFEVVRVSDAMGLRKCFVQAVRELTENQNVLMAIDDTMMAIRCGAGLTYQLYGSR